MAPTAVPVQKADIPGWVKAAIALMALAVIGALIWCFLLSRTVNRLERHNADLVRWTREVQAWTVGVSNALWGPGGDPCCEPPKPPPELE